MEVHFQRVTYKAADVRKVSVMLKSSILYQSLRAVQIGTNVPCVVVLGY